RGQAQSDEPFTEKLDGAAPSERAMREDVRHKKQQTHEERLQMTLPEDKGDLRRYRRLGVLIDIPAADVTVGHTRVHVDHKENHGRAQIVDPGEPRGG